MKNKKMLLGTVLMIAALLAACGTTDNNETSPKENDKEIEMDSASDERMEVEHSDSGEVPDDLKETANPTYEDGSKAINETDHMESMNGAEETIASAYDTTAYVISDTPTNGGKRVENHKWVIQEEIKNANDKTLEEGTEVTVEADHMKGMEGATAEIESAEKTTVYMIDNKPTTGEDLVKNHK